MTKQSTITPSGIPGHYLVERPTFSDDRGFFREVMRLDELNEAIGFEFRPVQFNHSLSKPRVLRGLHAEPWNKLIYPVSGEVFLAFADVREDSDTFGKIETYHFDAETRHLAFFVPIGVANSICNAGKSDVHYLYLVDDYYKGIPAKAIAWNDPDLAIAWSIKNPILSQRDIDNAPLRALFPDKFK